MRLPSFFFILCFFAAVALFTAPAHAVNNPFISPAGKEQATSADNSRSAQPQKPMQSASPFRQSTRATPQQTSGANQNNSSYATELWGNALVKVTRMQRSIRSELSSQLRGLKTNPQVWGLLGFLAMAFAYGALHAAGPGHGKAVATSFVIARGESPARAALLGLVMGATHAASAALLVLGLHAVLEHSLMAHFQSSGIWIERVSYAIVGLIALWLVYEAVTDQPGSDNGPTAPHRDLWATGLAAGMVPCPGAAIVLLFSVSLGATGFGLAAVAAMALGMGTTIATAGVAAACCGKGAISLSKARPGPAMLLRRGFAMLGGVAIFLFSAMLLRGTWS